VADLVYTGITSLDGYVNDVGGAFDWAAPDAEVHAFVNDLERPVGTYLYGRRLYEVMRAWESPEWLTGTTEVERDFATIWRQADKVVYSSTLSEVPTARTRLERDFDPAAVRQLVVGSDADVSVGGPTLAAQALRTGLVDEVRQFLQPVVVGGGTPFLPAYLHLSLDLLDERRFGSGVVYLRYRTRRGDR
jgi:dihydrofolate reductase